MNEVQTKSQNHLANTNMLWGYVIAQTLQHMGIEYAVICPGSRSNPLVFGFTAVKEINAIPVLDERNAAFFALGLAKRTQKPAVLICTSGTAGANFYPAVLEAKRSEIPLILLTADRPVESRFCSSAQTMENQGSLYGNNLLLAQELMKPESTHEAFSYLRQTICHAAMQAMGLNKGVVHLNIPFNEVLSPEWEEGIDELRSLVTSQVFYKNILPLVGNNLHLNDASINQVLSIITASRRGVIIAGYQHQDNIKATVELAKILKWPILADVLSSIRGYQEDGVEIITHYDICARNGAIDNDLKPGTIIQIGDLPTSKPLRKVINELENVHSLIIDSSLINRDPLHRNTSFVNISLPLLLSSLKDTHLTLSQEPTYTKQWGTYQKSLQTFIDNQLSLKNDFFEGKIYWLLSEYLPVDVNVFIATSMPVRDAEYFWKTNNKKHNIYANRGLNGIDGLISTALGVAYNDKPSVLVVGDLSFFHDLSALHLKEKFKGNLTIIVINNNGGRIFENLPISQYQEVFEDFVVMKQNLNIQNIVSAYGISYSCLNSWDSLIKQLSDLSLPGIKVIEIKTDAKLDKVFRNKLLNQEKL